MPSRKKPTPPAGPFPYVDTLEWRQNLVQAGLKDDRCNLSEDALKRLSYEVIHIKSVVKTRGRGPSLEVLGFKDEAIEKVVTPYGVIYQLRGVDQPGLGGAVNLFNIRFAFELAADPTVTPGTVTPATDAAGAPLAQLEARFDDMQHLRDHLAFAERRLASAEHSRPYDLRADLEASGQHEPGVYHMVRLVVGDKTYHVPAATAGSNRTKHRAELFGIGAGTGILGLSKSALGGSDKERWTDPGQWRDAYTAKLNEAYHDDTGAAGDNSEGRPASDLWRERAREAFKVRTVPAHLVIGYAPASTTNSNFDAALSATNLRTHLRGPLDFSAENQAMSNGRTLVDQCLADGDITPTEHAVLTGQTPAADLADTPVDAVLALIRLVDRIVYPRDTPAGDAARRRIRQILVEPAPSQLGTKHAKAREQVRVALLTQAITGLDLQEPAMDTPDRQTLRKGRFIDDWPLDVYIKIAIEGDDPHGRRLARAELAHLAVPGLVNARVLLGPHGSTGDRRNPATKLAAAIKNRAGVELFIEAIHALADVIAVRAGHDAAREGIDPGKIRCGGKADPTPATAAWFHQTWPRDTPDEDPAADEDSTIDSDRTTAEEWQDLHGELEKVIRGAEDAVGTLRDHIIQMSGYIAEGRGLAANERSDTIERMMDIGDAVDDATKRTRRLKAPEPDDFAYGGSTSGPGA